MRSKHICPSCGGKEFITTAHVVQNWLVDENGNFVKDKGMNIVVEEPDDENTWTCVNCGREGIVEDTFERVEITIEKTQRIAKEFDVTQKQLEDLKAGINLFQEELEEELECGDCEYDYAVNDADGRTIVNWSR